MPQPVAGEGSFYQQIAALCSGGIKDGLTGVPVFQFNAHQLGGNVVVQQLPDYLICRWAWYLLSANHSQHRYPFRQTKQRHWAEQSIRGAVSAGRSNDETASFPQPA